MKWNENIGYYMPKVQKLMDDFDKFSSVAGM